MKLLLLPVAIALSVSASTAQDTPGTFASISKAVKEYKIDTSDAPADKKTDKIKELRSLKGGFNINEAIEYKIQEEIEKNETSIADLQRLRENFKTGTGRKWLDNAITWIYREHFSYKELRQLVRFYKKPAGQKMAKAFPVIMLQSLVAGETIQKVITKK